MEELDLLESLLSRVPLFKALSPEDISLVKEHFEMIEGRAGDQLCVEGHDGEALYVIESGQVRVHKLTAAGFEEDVAVLGPGDVIGEIAALDGQPCSATATVVDKALFFKMPIAAFTVLRLQASPAIYKVIRSLSLTLCERIRLMNKRTRELQADPERVRQLILRRRRQKDLSSVGLGLMAVPAHTSSSKVPVRPAPSLKPVPRKGKRATASTAPQPILVGDFDPLAHLDPILARVAFLRQLGLLQSLTDAEFVTLAGLLDEESFEDGDVICQEGAKAQGLYILASGRINVCKQLVGDQAQVLATLRPGAMVGEVSLIDGGRRSASCLASGETTLFTLSFSDFERLFSTNNPLAFRFIEIIGIDLSLRLRTADDQFADIFDEEMEAPKVIHKLDRVRKTLDTGEVNQPKLLESLKKLFGFG